MQKLDSKYEPLFQYACLLNGLICEPVCYNSGYKVQSIALPRRVALRFAHFAEKIRSRSHGSPDYSHSLAARGRYFATQNAVSQKARKILSVRKQTKSGKPITKRQIPSVLSQKCLLGACVPYRSSNAKISTKQENQ